MTQTPPFKAQQCHRSSMYIAIVSSDRVTQTLASRILERLAYPTPECFDSLTTLLMSSLQADVILLDAADAVGNWEADTEQYRETTQIVILGDLVNTANYLCISKPLQKEVLAAALLDLNPRKKISNINHEAVEELLQLFGASGLREMIDALAADLPQQQARLNQALLSRDYTQLKHVAHGLHGAALQFGATEFARLCSTIERRCAEQDGAVFTDPESLQMIPCYAELISQLSDDRYVE
ncbi:Hpt domain-containing protein [Zhongshania aliphaticivorans]|uniref:Hpt domain-containing protein n=1 Tax=Zhongshania aliphaticivorans TaxID=1470434 RepID=UPI0012E49EC7|nr:Hpt domain-containing protein [Zhongshania aliphaticivorans]CAA0092438.1 Uncharacterised protein [Zhongshania aliphaticivorans]